MEESVSASESVSVSVSVDQYGSAISVNEPSSRLYSDTCMFTSLSVISIECSPMEFMIFDINDVPISIYVLQHGQDLYNKPSLNPSDFNTQ